MPDQIFPIELVGGPLDGTIEQLKKPAEPTVKIKSSFRADVFHIYEFDSNEKNNQFPLKYRYQGYEKI